MHINEKGLALIKHFEGLYLKAYLDPVGIWTIGYGHTQTAKQGMQITEVQAENLLRSDLQGHEKFVANAVNVALSDNQFAALVSFAFNVGNGNFKSSTLLRLLNQGDYHGAEMQFKRWVKGTVNGQKVTLQGLVRRRRAERSLFEKGVLDFGYGPIALAA